jgi:B12-binding domain/radical SAM domain protein
MEYKLFFYDSKENKYSINALLGAIEEDKELKDLPIFFFEKVEDLFFEKDLRNSILCFSFFSTQFFEIKDILEKLKELKKSYENLYFVAGGPHPSGDPQGVLDMGFDIVVKGEGERIFPNLIKEVISGKKIFGIFHDEKKIDLNYYFPFSKKFGRFGPIEISRGCPFGCYFCQTPRIFGGIMRHRSIEKILEIVEIMVERNLKDIRFITPNAFAYGSSDGMTINLKKLEELLIEIRKIIGEEGRIFFGSFPSEVRPEHVLPETVELIRLYANNDNIVIGAQSGSQRILDLAHRRHKVDDVYRAVETATKYGLKVNVDFIFGLPYENEDDINQTVKVIEDLIKMGAKIHAHTFMPLPGTPFEKFPPGKSDRYMRKVINKLLPKGVVFGNFREQEEIAWKLYNYFSSKEA